MNKRSNVALQNTNSIQNKRYRKNEILACCSICNCERVLAYWDTELEHYIYLSDEPVLCSRCQEEHILSSVQPKHELVEKLTTV